MKLGRVVLKGLLGYAMVYLVLGGITLEFDVTDWCYSCKLWFVALGSLWSLLLVLIEIDKL